MASTDVGLPQPGDIWLTALGAARVGEPGKTRPAVVVSAAGQHSGSVYDLVAVVPVSATLPPSPVRPAVVAGGGTGLEADSVAVVRAIRAVSPVRLVRYLGRTDDQTLAEIRLVLAVVLGLP